MPFLDAPPHATVPFVTLAVAKSHGSSELSVATPRVSVDHQHRRFPLYDEDLGELGLNPPSNLLTFHKVQQ